MCIWICYVFCFTERMIATCLPIEYATSLSLLLDKHWGFLKTVWFHHLAHSSINKFIWMNTTCVCNFRSQWLNCHLPKWRAWWCVKIFASELLWQLDAYRQCIEIFASEPFMGTSRGLDLLRFIIYILLDSIEILSYKFYFFNVHGAPVI